MSDRSPRPSPEITAVLTRLANAFREHDTEAMRNLYSRSSAFLNVGSDADEVWEDYESFIRIAEAQLEEMGAFGFEVDRVEGFELGEVGWGIVFARFITEDGETHPMRMSNVLCLEEGVWRCVLSHNSIPVSNEAVFGVGLTTTLADLLDSLDAEAMAPIDAREGTVALMFTDIEGSTSLAAEMGDRRWAEVVADHDRFLTETVERHGGRVIKTLGDGALVSFEGARAALRSAVALQEGFARRPTTVRIGIHAGDVVHHGDDILGGTVNKAARVTAAAHGGQVVVSSVVRELAGGGDEFSFGEPFLAELKGIPGIHELVPLVTGFEPAAPTNRTAAKERA